MQIKNIKVGTWYETPLGAGPCVRAGGTFPPSVQINIRKPFPMGVRNVTPRDVKWEVRPSEAPVLHYRVEYDKNYSGGDYSDVGEFVYIPELEVKERQRVDGLSEENALSQAFEEATGLNRRCIIHFPSDERFDSEGNSIES